MIAKKLYIFCKFIRGDYLFYQRLGECLLLINGQEMSNRYIVDPIAKNLFAGYCDGGGAELFQWFVRVRGKRGQEVTQI